MENICHYKGLSLEPEVGDVIAVSVSKVRFGRIWVCVYKDRVASITDGHIRTDNKKIVPIEDCYLVFRPSLGTSLLYSGYSIEAEDDLIYGAVSDEVSFKKMGVYQNWKVKPKIGDVVGTTIPNKVNRSYFVLGPDPLNEKRIVLYNAYINKCISKEPKALYLLERASAKTRETFIETSKLAKKHDSIPARYYHLLDNFYSNNLFSWSTYCDNSWKPEFKDCELYAFIYRNEVRIASNPVSRELMAKASKPL